jgi:hypothetical protein
MVWDGVTSAVGSDARKRANGDAVASARSDDAADGPRRRNPKGGRHFAGARENRMNDRVTIARVGRRLQSAGHNARINFSAAC